MCPAALIEHLYSMPVYIGDCLKNQGGTLPYDTMITIYSPVKVQAYICDKAVI